MATLGWRGPEADPAARLLAAIRECEQHWQNDPAYRDIAFKLGRVTEELDYLTASPGKREALRAAMPNPAGQEPTHRDEPPMQAEKPDAAY